jgi:Dolichyl-phosphate-mannose-protein mannosyltransferase
VLGVWKGSFVAGGSDSSGYVSEATALTAGRLKVPQRLAREVPWPSADWTFAPLGWRPATEPGARVPSYAAGYPLLMALASLMAGPRAMFWVVPLLGALSVWLTYRLGTKLDSDATGLMSALLLASSPIFVFQLLQPMSDVPVTAWWLAATVLAAGNTRASAAWSGAAAAAAVVTRPNLSLLAIPIAAFVAASELRNPTPPHEHPEARRAKLPRTLLFTIPVVGAAVLVGWLHEHLYGSPFTTGYGDPSTLYALSNVPSNAMTYSRWLFATETPLVLVALLAPIVMHRWPLPPRLRGQGWGEGPLAWTCLAIVGLVAVSYLVYAPFDNWSYLRFLLPAYPLLFALAIGAMTRAADPFRRRGRWLAPVLFVAAIVIWHLRFIGQHDLLDIAVAEARYLRVAEHVKTRLPSNAAIIGAQHTGSIRHYAGRLTIRWDWLAPAWLDRAIETLEERGYRPMVIVEDWEEAEIRKRFASSPASALDWTPRAELAGPPRVRVYDVADRLRSGQGERWTAEVIR